MPSLKLYYFDAPGRAEVIRLALHYANIPFEDIRITREDWQDKYKALSPSGMVPMLEVDGVKYVESISLLMYACTLAKLVPEDPIKLLTCMQLIQYVDGELMKMREAANESLEKAAEVSNAIMEKADRFAEMKGTEGPVDMADIYALGLRITCGRYFPDKGLKSPIPGKVNLNKLADRAEANAHIKAYLDPATPTLYYFNFPGLAEPTRLAFAYGKMPLKEVRFEIKDWVPQYRDQSPTNKVPMLVVGNEKYVESTAIYLYACKRSGLLPDCPLKLMQCMQFITHSQEFSTLFRQIVRASEEERAATAARVNDEMMAVLERLDKFAAMKGTEGPVDMADVYALGFYRSMSERCKFFQLEYRFDKYENMMKLRDRALNDHSIAAYCDSYKF